MKVTQLFARIERNPAPKAETVHWNASVSGKRKSVLDDQSDRA